MSRVCKSFTATDEYAVDAIRDMDPSGSLPGGAGMRSGVLRARVTVWEPGEDAHPSLPTLRELLEKNVDAATGTLTFVAPGNTRLSMDPAPLRALPAEYLDYRVSPGCEFVTHAALERARGAAS